MDGRYTLHQHICCKDRTRGSIQYYIQYLCRWSHLVDSHIFNKHFHLILAVRFMLSFCFSPPEIKCIDIQTISFNSYGIKMVYWWILICFLRDPLDLNDFWQCWHGKHSPSKCASACSIPSRLLGGMRRLFPMFCKDTFHLTSLSIETLFYVSVKPK